VVALDLRSGGNMRVQPAPKKAIGAPGTVHLDILTVVEPDIIIYRTHLPDSFPAKVRAEDQGLQEVVQLLPQGEGQTKIVSSMIGWGTSPEWSQVYTYYAKGNAKSYDKLAEQYTKR
jgi:hypothetical protein